MSDQSASPDATRTAVSLRTGSKVCILLALAALAVAVYFYAVPMSVRTQTGAVFSCGSASSPPDQEFQRNVCANLTDIGLFRAYLFVALALISAVVGVLLFGIERRAVPRRSRGYISEDGQFRRGRDGGSPQDSDQATDVVATPAGDGDGDESSTTGRS
ncbi:hypothetical protein ATK17_1397 [Branchiibius hedensis]|uniref:Transmembrane protein n=1 Tax=Branchiibius hedensis TaxID=672460 RepID=A0A2Y8ZRP1_9MICO|nr:hypothetical protein [Branchiibius hedensis]PWJ25282.1 hypothetical protein ATK17_1397 [Branchiibius hedensis]SSA34096.1 hypothetical protein SAMN04489750_1397 [Branchiibius hedensis]